MFKLTLTSYFKRFHQKSPTSSIRWPSKMDGYRQYNTGNSFKQFGHHGMYLYVSKNYA